MSDAELAKMVRDLPEEYDDFVESGRSPKVINRAAAYAVEHNFSDEAVETLVDEISEMEPYASDSVDIEEKVSDHMTKASVYQKIVDGFEDNVDAANKVHWNSGQNLIDMQLREQFDTRPEDLYPDDAFTGPHWTQVVDLEFNKDGAIAGYGKTAHAVLRYVDNKENVSRQEAAEAINGAIDKGDLMPGSYFSHSGTESAIICELEDKDDSISFGDFMDWQVEKEKEKMTEEEIEKLNL